MTVIIGKESPRQAAVIELLAQSDAYAASLYPAESNHMVDLDMLDGPNVTFLVARDAGHAVGCCALVAAGDGTAEIKRMFVDPRARGIRAGRALLDATEQAARERGIRIVRLETGIRQPEAIGLYRKSGYRDIAPFGSYQPDPLSLFMEKRLA